MVAIDSFSHMYVFKKPFEEIVRLPHLLTFANDLHSGKLHREFHHGPDPGTDVLLKTNPINFEYLISFTEFSEFVLNFLK